MCHALAICCNAHGRCHALAICQNANGMCHVLAMTYDTQLHMAHGFFHELKWHVPGAMHYAFMNMSGIMRYVTPAIWHVPTAICYVPRASMSTACAMEHVPCGTRYACMSIPSATAMNHEHERVTSNIWFVT